MSVQEDREKRKRQGANLDRYEFKLEKQEIPSLHSGFTENCSKLQNKSAFFLSVWYTGGQYKCCLLDREANEKCFVDIGEITTLLTTLEDGLVNNTLDWIDASVSSARSFGA